MNIEEADWILSAAAAAQVGEKMQAEAHKFLHMAQNKILFRDWGSAKAFCKKAEVWKCKLYMRTRIIINVLENADLNIQKHPNWYEILCIKNPKCNEFEILWKHEKLMNLLDPQQKMKMGGKQRPIKGEKEALDLVNKAFRILSNQNKRAHYDNLMEYIGLEDNHNQNDPVKSSSDKTENDMSFKCDSLALVQCNHGLEGSSSSPNNNAETSCPQRFFWTSCSHCFAQYKYNCIYEDQRLRCRLCMNDFIAAKAFDVSVELLKKLTPQDLGLEDSEFPKYLHAIDKKASLLYLMEEMEMFNNRGKSVCWE